MLGLGLFIATESQCFQHFANKLLSDRDTPSCYYRSFCFL